MMLSRAVLLTSLGVLLAGAPAVAQPAGSPAAGSSASAAPAATSPPRVRQPQGRREAGAPAAARQRGASAQGGNRQPAQRGGQPAQRQAAGGGLNLNLGPATASGGAGRPGDAFATSGPYASDAQIQRYTGRREVRMPQAPINIFSGQQTPSQVQLQTPP